MTALLEKLNDQVTATRQAYRESFIRYLNHPPEDVSDNDEPDAAANQPPQQAQPQQIEDVKMGIANAVMNRPQNAEPLINMEFLLPQAPPVEPQVQAMPGLPEAQLDYINAQRKRIALTEIRDALGEKALVGSVVFQLMFDAETPYHKAAWVLFDGELHHPRLNPFVYMLSNAHLATTAIGRKRFRGSEVRVESTPENVSQFCTELLMVLRFGVNTLKPRIGRTWQSVVDSVRVVADQEAGRYSFQFADLGSLSDEALFYQLAGDDYQRDHPWPPERLRVARENYRQVRHLPIAERLLEAKIWNREAVVCIQSVMSTIQESKVIEKLRISAQFVRVLYRLYSYESLAVNCDSPNDYLRFWHLAAICKFLLCCEWVVPSILFDTNAYNNEQAAATILGIAHALFFFK